MRYSSLALTLLFALAACSPAPDKLALAKRIQDSQGSLGTQLEQGLMSFAARAPFSAAPELYRASVRRTVAAHKDDIAKAEDDISRIYAEASSAEDMAAYVEYLESQLGKSVTAKIARNRAESLALGGPRRELELTKEESAAREAAVARLNSDPEKQKAAMTQVSERVNGLVNTIRGETILGFCNRGGECPPELVERMKTQAGQK